MVKHFSAKYFTLYDILNITEPYRVLLKKVCDTLEIKKGDIVLEAGCGTGNLCLEIKKRGGVVIGIDNNKHALEIYKKKDKFAKIIQTDLSKRLPFPNSYFNKIACIHTFYWIPTAKRKYVLKELLRILKKGGLIVFVNPTENFNSLKIYLEAIKSTQLQMGLIYTIKLILRYLVSSIKIVWYSVILLKEKKQMGSICIMQKELEDFLINSGCNIVEVSQVYVKQSILICARKV